MSTRVIKILAGYPKSQKLELSDDGYSEVDQGAEVEWEIDNHSEHYPGSIDVESIDAIDSKKGSNDKIFKLPPRKVDGKFKGEIDTGLGAGKKWKYNIHWTGNNERFTFDPIIAVKPTTNVQKQLILGIAVAVAAFITFQFFRNKRCKTTKQDSTNTT